METQLQQFDKLKADITVYLAPVENMVVNSKETQESVMNFVKEVKSYAKKVEEKRVELVDPLNKEVKRINAYAKEILQPLETAESKIKTLLLKWNQELEKIRQEELKKIEAEKAAREAELKAKAQKELENAEFERSLGLEEQAANTEVLAAVTLQREEKEVAKEVKAQVKTVAAMAVKGVKTVWKFEVENKRYIPLEYMVPDEVAIRKAIASGVRSIPGIRVYEEQQLAIRG